MVRASSGNRRADILDVAIDLVARAGLRGLTHRAVDAGAGLPEGSTSAYFRTRAALLTAVVARLGERIGTDVDDLAVEATRHPGDAARAIELTLKQLDSWLSDPAPLAARLELSLESIRRPELGEAMANWRTAFEALVARILRDVGLGHASERATLIVACMDGVLLRALTAAPADGVPVLGVEARAYAVQQARTLLTSLLISARVLDSGQDPLTDVMPGC